MRSDNLSTGLGRFVSSFNSSPTEYYYKHSTYIFLAIEKLIQSDKLNEPHILLGIWEYLLEYEKHYGYTTLLGGELSDTAHGKAIYSSVFFFGADNLNQGSSILVPIFHKIAEKIAKLNESVAFNSKINLTEIITEFQKKYSASAWNPFSYAIDNFIWEYGQKYEVEYKGWVFTNKY